MGEEVKVYQKSLEGFKQTFDIKHQIGSETTPLAYQKFHKDAIYMHRKKVYKIIKTHLLPNDEDADRYVIVESALNPKHYTTPTVYKIPKIPSNSEFSEKIIGGIKIKLTDLDIDKTIRGYKRFSLYDDTPFTDMIDGQVKAGIASDGQHHVTATGGKGDPFNYVFGCDGEEFTFHTRGIVLDIPIQEDDTSEVGDEIYNVKQETLDGLHVIEHVLQHAGVTIANISYEDDHKYS
jgi:hypothetical protein